MKFSILVTNNIRLNVTMKTDINKKLDFDWFRRFWL